SAVSSPAPGSNVAGRWRAGAPCFGTGAPRTHALAGPGQRRARPRERRDGRARGETFVTGMEVAPWYRRPPTHERPGGRVHAAAGAEDGLLCVRRTRAVPAERRLGGAGRA